MENQKKQDGNKAHQNYPNIKKNILVEFLKLLLQNSKFQAFTRSF